MGSKGDSVKTFSGKSFEDVDHIINADGMYLFCRYWKPNSDVKALMFHIHGYAEHCGRSKELAEKLMEIGIFSFSHDHVCHGESQGLRGHVLDYHVLLRDMWQHIDVIREKYPNVPLFLYGHSMGGGLAVLAAYERPDVTKGILLSAPYIKPSPDTATPIKVLLAKIAASIIPKLRVGKLDSSFLSRDQKQVEDYMKDPLVDTDGLRAGFGVQLLKMSEDLSSILPEVKTPMYVAHSEDDKICDIGGTKLLVEVSKSEDKTFRLYKEAYHMLEHETESFVESYFTDVFEWLKKRV